MSETLLSLENISLIRDEKALLNSVDLNLLRGEVISILGPNGAGKSSLLSCIGLSSSIKYIGNIKIRKKKYQRYIG